MTHSLTANENSRLLFWSHVREFAVPTSMIESATARRAIGDWAGACAAAHVDVDLNLRTVARTHGRQLAAQVRADLRQLVPDLLRWHFPRVAPDGPLRPGLTVPLARYLPGPVHLVARTPPAWADAGQRIGLALWAPTVRPRPHPDRRFRLDLHRHLWDARRTGELRQRARPDWLAEAKLLRANGLVTVRLSARRWLVIDTATSTITSAPARNRDWPILPDAATWPLPDLELLDAGLIEAERLHPLVASALAPGGRPVARHRDSTTSSRLVECRGARHRIGLVGGALVPLDHDADEIRREELLMALGGNGLPCLRAIDEAHRHPECLVDVRARLCHGDTAGALATAESLLGPQVLHRSEALRDEFEIAARRRIRHGLFRAGLTR
ncbi:MAG TPA: hypothetical protein VJ914_19230 [Pseudonocardiaceae bacterium]|nr:hypothetical protein [Pseudonocardiaceae bacterium]